ncbi:MAG: hypothetical protein A3B07_00365 [Candidatus Yonathbacteria bacterium RIFCSPLOWO2_01_FULL_43_27]|uniref:PKD domain-containing protein n=1 Tax=Candidatus Yonathbacteria bacterium RIFCSPLOWO2_01_FULL_43_27 TaxID=1802726 RepID=A0A1G2SEZ0_9BACT|nr:MAG: hypothetical protein A2658_00975 [Candidatus Yonathbacteria bacterium RIFCSPHIGHO2_01_FULL_44_19]OHA83209.1 MAG: hypothetical protein A3B07_00365 [Candidatus Yonathbacteria bacterium RIFCSPLOWO2_01_FULL_43_27]
MRILVVAILFLLPSVAFAQILFNEVTLSPTEERFIELYNSGDADVDLTGWYVQRKTATGSTFGSLVSSSKFENKIIPARGYFLISRSTLPYSDIVLDTLSLTESNTLHLKNPEREVVDQIAWETVSEGRSYQKLSTGEWVIGQSTPRAQNSEKGEVSSPALVQEGMTTPVVIGAPAVSNNQKIAIDIGPKERVVLVGQPTTFEGRIEGTDKKPIQSTQMKWSFGDGAVAEGWGIANVTHTYHYPGEYNVVLNLPAFFTTSSRVRVRAIMPEIAVRVDGYRGRSAIIIENRMHEDLDLSGWRLSLEGKTFTFPMTIISAKKSVAFPSEITLLAGDKESRPELFYPNGVRVSLVASESQNTSSSTPIIISESVHNNTNSVMAVQKVASVVPTQQARLVDVIEDASPQTDYILGSHNEKMWAWYVGIFFLASFALVGLLLIRSKKTLVDEFEILEESEEN